MLSISKVTILKQQLLVKYIIYVNINYPQTTISC